MAWIVNGSDITMVEGDYGIVLPYTFSRISITPSDSVAMVVKDRLNGNEIFEKIFTDLTGNTIDVVLTEEESSQLPVGVYVYRLDWYRDGSFMCNLIPLSHLRVVEKA